MGFVPEVLEYRGCKITIFDLGGGSKIRPVWTKYYAEIHGVIFVIDSSAPERVAECKQVLCNLLQNKKVSGKPVLILANKQDVEGALDEIDILETLDVESIVNKYRCPTRLETCSAITIQKNKPDKPIADGFRWLIDTIVVHYDELHGRVVKDLEKERLKIKRHQEEIKERIRHRVAERERQEQELILAADMAADAVQVGSGPNTSEESVNNAGADDAYPHSPSTSPPTDRRRRDHSSGEAAELRELGFPSTGTLSTDAEQLSAGSSPSRRKGRRGSSPRLSPSLQLHRSDSGAAGGNNSSHRIIVVSSPTASITSPTGTTVSSPTPNTVVSSSPRNSDSGLPNTPAATTPHSLLNGELRLRLRDDEEDLSSPRVAGECCVQIDSDDELYNIDQRSHRSNGSVAQYVRDQLELETNQSQGPKKKSFLKRYHKTVPANDSQSLSVP